jgi:hypothetical protein
MQTWMKQALELPKIFHNSDLCDENGEESGENPEGVAKHEQAPINDHHVFLLLTLGSYAHRTATGIWHVLNEIAEIEMKKLKLDHDLTVAS